MKVAILGAGPVATSLAIALARAGLPPTALWARRADAAKRAGRLAGVPSYGGDAWPSAVRSAQVLILAVRDEAIGPLAHSLAAADVPTAEQVLIHCAGSSSAEAAFEGVAARGKGVLHPLRAIADGATTADLLGSTTFGIQGDSEGARIAAALANRLGATVLPLRAEQMTAYHAAAAIASNYLVGLIDFAESVLGGAGVDPTLARNALLDLAQGALGNIRDKGIPNALTGPIRRGDVATVRAHLEALEQGDSEALLLYCALGRQCLPLAAGVGDADEGELSEIASLLANSAAVDPTNQ